MQLERLENTLFEINRFGYSDQGINRLAYSKVEREAVRYFIELCEREGLQVRMDSCGNMIARREGLNPDAPVVAIGSHLDTVDQGGKFDGALGVISALEVIRSLNEKGIRTEHPIELIAFACEESSRFGVSTIGSKAMAGLLQKEHILQLKDKNGLTFKHALQACGLDYEHLENSERRSNEFRVFLELHIEQGPILEMRGKQIGIATGIAAPSRFNITIQGHAAHSGTTPMSGRKDAFLGAAQIALELEQAALAESVHGTVATVGVCDIKPGAMNVVPDFADIQLDIRGISVPSKNRVIEWMFRTVEQVKAKRNCQIQVVRLSDEKPVQLNADVIESLIDSCEEQGLTYIQMPSGAGHDAMNMARLCPTGLIFVPSKNGISHHHEEFTSAEQIGWGASLLEKEVLKWSVGAALSKQQ